MVFFFMDDFVEVSAPARRASNQPTGPGGHLPVPFHARILPGFASLDLPAQGGGDFEPDRRQRVVASFRVNVRPGHGQMHLCVEGGRAVLLTFQHDFRSGDGGEATQAFELLFQPRAQAGTGVETADSELGVHKCEVGGYGLRWADSATLPPGKQRRQTPRGIYQ
jgi:hypothetical protein